MTISVGKAQCDATLPTEMTREERGSADDSQRPGKSQCQLQEQESATAEHLYRTWPACSADDMAKLLGDDEDCEGSRETEFHVQIPRKIDHREEQSALPRHQSAKALACRPAENGGYPDDRERIEQTVPAFCETGQ